MAIRSLFTEPVTYYAHRTLTIVHVYSDIPVGWYWLTCTLLPLTTSINLHFPDGTVLSGKPLEKSMLTYIQAIN